MWLSYIKSWLSYIKSNDLLVFMTVLISFLVYRYSVIEKYRKLEILLASFSNELYKQRAWFVGEYGLTFDCKEFYSPLKVVYSVCFYSAIEIQKTGLSILNKFDANFGMYIPMFNQRIKTFNDLVQVQYNLSSQKLAMPLQQKLENFGYLDEGVSFEAFRDNIKKLNNTQDMALFFYAVQVNHFHKQLHNELISDSSNPFSIHTLWSQLTIATEKTLKNYNKNMPWYLKKCFLVCTLLVSIVVFISIERYCK
jgi:hypothetical protein